MNRRRQRWSHRRNRWRSEGRFRWTLGLLASALLLPLILASSAPLLAALIPGAFITMVGVHALDGEEDAKPKALTAEIVSPHDIVEQHRIANAVDVTQSRQI